MTTTVDIRAIQENPIRSRFASKESASPASENTPLPEGLNGLSNFQVVNAERRIEAKGSESRLRATTYASILGVDTDKLAKWVGAFLRRVPQENRWAHQDDLEQSIWAHLYKEKHLTAGNWELVKLSVRGAYTRWYTAYAEERQLAVEATNRAISLEREYQRDQQERPEGVGHDIGDPTWVGWETALVGNVDAIRLFNHLPESMRAMGERKANGEPQNVKERKRLSRWLKGGSSKRNPTAQTNKDIIANVLKGTHVGAIVWYKAIR